MRKVSLFILILSSFGHILATGEYKFTNYTNKDNDHYIRDLVEQKQDLSKLSPYESPLFCKYLYRCLPELLKPLLKLKPNINIPDDQNKRPLNYAIESGNVICVVDLLKAGADPNTILHSSLSTAICTRDLPIISLLLRYGANPRQQPYLELALLQRRTAPDAINTNMVKLLLQYGAQSQDHDANILQVTKCLYDEMCNNILDNGSGIQPLKDSNKVLLRHLRVKKLVSNIEVNGNPLPQELVEQICQYCVE